MLDPRHVFHLKTTQLNPCQRPVHNRPRQEFEHQSRPKTSLHIDNFMFFFMPLINLGILPSQSHTPSSLPSKPHFHTLPDVFFSRSATIYPHPASFGIWIISNPIFFYIALYNVGWSSSSNWLSLRRSPNTRNSLLKNDPSANLYQLLDLALNAHHLRMVRLIFFQILPF
ncbi:hypothetical protein BGX38DRAFT_823247 [Terfezia claveryi]|nr:hypothetical protein BGX38DRAFT_823247 [Terfezia claveryi]